MEGLPLEGGPSLFPLAAFAAWSGNLAALRQINATHAPSAQIRGMIRFAMTHFTDAVPAGELSDTVRDRVAVHAAIPAAIPAAWPAGVSQFAIAYDVCRRFDRVAMRNDRSASARD